MNYYISGYYDLLDILRMEKEMEQKDNLRKVAAPPPPWSRKTKQKSKIKR